MKWRRIFMAELVSIGGGLCVFAMLAGLHALGILFPSESDLARTAIVLLAWLALACGLSPGFAYLALRQEHHLGDHVLVAVLLPFVLTVAAFCLWGAHYVSGITDEETSTIYFVFGPGYVGLVGVFALTTLGLAALIGVGCGTLLKRLGSRLGRERAGVA